MEYQKRIPWNIKKELHFNEYGRLEIINEYYTKEIDVGNILLVFIEMAKEQDIFIDKNNDWYDLTIETLDLIDDDVITGSIHLLDKNSIHYFFKPTISRHAYFKNGIDINIILEGISIADINFSQNASKSTTKDLLEGKKQIISFMKNLDINKFKMLLDL